MSRMRTHKTSKYFTISNETAQDDDISLQSLGLLTFCLSMPEDWEFNPKMIWKKRDVGRNAVYEMFNELIETFHCIRISRPNPKAKNLPGETDYEIFDDVEDCKKRIEELEKTEKFLEHGYKFKKCFRHSKNRDVETGNAENWNPTKETPVQKKQNNNKSVVVHACLQERKDLSDDDKIALSKKPEDRVKLALAYAELEPPTSTLIQELIWHCNQKVPPIADPKRAKIDPKECKSLAMKAHDECESKTYVINILNKEVELTPKAQGQSFSYQYDMQGFKENFLEGLKKVCLQEKNKIAGEYMQKVCNYCDQGILNGNKEFCNRKCQIQHMKEKKCYGCLKREYHWHRSTTVKDGWCSDQCFQNYCKSKLNRDLCMMLGLSFYNNPNHMDIDLIEMTYKLKNNKTGEIENFLIDWNDIEKR